MKAQDGCLAGGREVGGYHGGGGEDVPRLQDAHDILRVCSLYAARRVSASPFPAWLPTLIELTFADTP